MAEETKISINLDGARSKVLMADDEELNLQLLEAYLAPDGYQLVKAGNGDEALEKARHENPDLVLLDVVMPGRSGFDVCRAIKTDARLQFIPVVIITALTGSEHRVQGIEAGADDFISKPFNRAEIRARVKSLLRLKRLHDQLESTESVIFAFAAAVESKDPYTEGHLRRMADYSERLGKQLKLSPAEATMLRYGGILHDIGKIGISEAILQKPAALTHEEFEEIKKHTVIGEKICKPLRFGDQVGPIVRGHHERWDGKGYPDGLVSEKIPIGARVVCVADAFDAMTTDRPYRRALPLDEAFKRLRDSAGTQFDPELVEPFIELIKTTGLIAWDA